MFVSCSNVIMSCGTHLRPNSTRTQISTHTTIPQRIFKILAIMYSFMILIWLIFIRNSYMLSLDCRLSFDSFDMYLRSWRLSHLPWYTIHKQLRKEKRVTFLLLTSVLWCIYQLEVTPKILWLWYKPKSKSKSKSKHIALVILTCT